MDKSYIILFKDIVRTMAVCAEKAMQYNKSTEDNKGFETATFMREDYEKLNDKLSSNETLNRADYAKIMVGAYIIANNTEKRIEEFNKALQGYKLDILPKLDRIMNETKDDAEAEKLANEIFQVIEKN